MSAFFNNTSSKIVYECIFFNNTSSKIENAQNLSQSLSTNIDIVPQAA